MDASGARFGEGPPASFLAAQVAGIPCGGGWPGSHVVVGGLLAVSAAQGAYIQCLHCQPSAPARPAGSQQPAGPACWPRKRCMGCCAGSAAWASPTWPLAPLCRCRRGAAGARGGLPSLRPVVGWAQPLRRDAAYEDRSGGLSVLEARIGPVPWLAPATFAALAACCSPAAIACTSPSSLLHPLKRAIALDWPADAIWIGEVPHRPAVFPGLSRCSWPSSRRRRLRRRRPARRKGARKRRTRKSSRRGTWSRRGS